MAIPGGAWTVSATFPDSPTGERCCSHRGPPARGFLFGSKSLRRRKIGRGRTVHHSPARPASECSYQTDPAKKLRRCPRVLERRSPLPTASASHLCPDVLTSGILSSLE